MFFLDLVEGGRWRRERLHGRQGGREEGGAGAVVKKVVLPSRSLSHSKEGERGRGKAEEFNTNSMRYCPESTKHMHRCF